MGGGFWGRGVVGAGRGGVMGKGVMEKVVCGRPQISIFHLGEKREQQDEEKDSRWGEW
jgi:hypothetical protein